MPTMGHSHRFLPQDLKAFNIESHIVVYKIEEENNTVFILRLPKNLK